jgi:cytidyltransferase-like protein
MKISVVSGGFDPLHSGHISYLLSASKTGDKLVVCLNSDQWLKKKKGNFFLPYAERKIILENLEMVDQVIDFEDDELGSVINGLTKLKDLYPNDEIVFCNGGDRDKTNIPEMQLKDITFQFSVGGDKKENSSSWILKNWSYQSSERVWGKFFDLFQDEGVKVKELIVQPGKGMSFQRHNFRNEIWLVSKGQCLIHYSEDDSDNKKEVILSKHDHFFVPKLSWHQITNPYDVQCHIIEIQYGQKTIEDDIERLYYFDGKSE